MTTKIGQSSFATQVAGRVLCYVSPNNGPELAVVARAVALTGRHEVSGLVVRGPYTHDLLRCLRAPTFGPAQPAVVDPGCWTKTIATADAPFGLPLDEDVLVPLSVDEWARSWLAAGATGMLTPSGFVESGDWPTLKSVLTAGAQVRDPRVTTLIATDADMLDPDRVQTFQSVVGEQHGGRPLAFVFAAKSTPLASRDRMAGLRAVVETFPGSIIVGAEVLAATDVLARGGSAAIGLLSSQRQPRRPQDVGGGFSPGYRPGMFLRELWETRNPSFYADWYRNRRAPLCAKCGRSPESFTADQADKDAILIHNVHAWLDVLSDLRRAGQQARSWLVGERWRARAAHAGIGPPSKGAPVDDLLDALCALDGPPPQRQPTPTG